MSTTHHKPRTSRLSRWRRSRGFTLIEVTFAGAIMAMVLTTSITVLQRGFSSLDTARNMTIAGQIMQSEIEKMRMNAWSVVSAYPTAATTLTIDSSFTSNPSVGTRFQLSRSATDIATGTTAGMRQITFTVTWKGYDGRSLTRSYVTYYGQNGLYDYYYNSL